MHLKRTTLLGTTVLAGVLALSAPAYAQSSAGSEPEATQVEEIVVTGSRIRRDPVTSPTPLIQVKRDQLLETGLSTVVDYLATIPALSNSLVPSDTTGSGLNDSGLAFANLRSLGTGRTLTLVDGRRHIGSSGGSLAVDIDTVPRLLIENIEIVTGGASSVYGADAVAGVLNFVLRKDYEGAEIDANYALINQDGQAASRVTALIGGNFFDDRLNVYAHAEYEKQDEVGSLDLDWLRRASLMIPNDMDPTTASIGPRVDGVYDNLLYSNLRRIDRPRWGQTTLRNQQVPTPTSDPDIPLINCTSATAFNSANCYFVQPGKTYWYDGTTARLANFGTRVGESSGSTTSASRPYNIGGDGDNPAMFSTESRVPRSESQRYQVGATYRVTDSIKAYVEAKYVDEKSFDVAQPTFFDINLANSYGAGATNPIRGTSQFDLRWSDNAFLPQLVKDAITANTVTPYSFNAAGQPVAGTPYASQTARHSMFGPERTQDNTRQVQRYVANLTGSYDQVGFIKNFDWDVSYTYGKAETSNTERAVDVLRFALAADAVVDTAGVVNGRPGEIVCRAKLIAASGGTPYDYNWGNADLRNYATGAAALSGCTPLNVFGAGNQSQAALDYIDAAITVHDTNTQQDAVASISGQLWDFWGAGAIGLALGVEYRRESTESIGRDADTGDRWLFLNTGPDFPEVHYETNEFFAEASIPLFRDSWLGQYAELSGSYRYSDYKYPVAAVNEGAQDVYGVNLVYRPIADITFKTSFNTSARVPDLSSNFRPQTQTFATISTDPCSTSAIAGLADRTIAGYRIANCTALATAAGYSFDFGNTTATTADDFLPIYGSTPGGTTGGNPALRAEQSESFTFSTVLQPRFIPNFSLVLDYYEIEVTDVINSPSVQGLAEACVSTGPVLNTDACSLIVRNADGASNTERFRIGGPGNANGFQQRPVNFAKLRTRGLDFDARYSIDTEEVFGRDLGQLNFSIGGLWLIEQDNYVNPASPFAYTPNAGYLFYPRVRFTSRVTWQPIDSLSMTWTADWQTSQDIADYRTYITNWDDRAIEYLRTGNFVRNDFSVRYELTDDVTLRAGVTNIFDAEQAPFLGTTLYSNFDPYGRRFNVGLNYKLW